MAMSARRPLPALAFLLALSLLTALVWWRVFDRSTGDSAAAPSPTCAAQQGIELPAPAQVSLIVLNGTDRAGLAGTVSDSLAGAGFQVGSPGNDTAAVSGVAELRFGPAGLAAATLLMYYIPGAVLVQTQDAADATVTVSIGDGFPLTGGVNNADQAAAAQAAAAASAAPGDAKPC